jgi:protein phosphatase
MFRLFYDLFGSGKAIISAKSEKGLKNNQEDSYFISTVIRGCRLIIVADGVGGHGHGDFASEFCVRAFSNEFRNIEKGFSPSGFLEQTSIIIAEKILQKTKEDESYKNCGTTVSGFLLSGSEYYTLNIGDSRVYLFREELLIQLTEDHSLVKKMVKEGLITEEEALVHPKRNIMTSALGQPLEMMTISIKGPQKWMKGDIILACTDGVHGFINDDRLSGVIKKSPPEALADHIVDYALKSGSTDNITCCCIKL